MFEISDRGAAQDAAADAAGPDASNARGAGEATGVVAAVAAADAAGARLDRVAALAPGPLQIGLLAAIDAESLDHAGRVELLQAWERASRWVTARQLEAVVAVAGPEATNQDDFAREDVRVALRETGGSWRQDVDLARSLRGRLAPARAALEAGTLSYPQARALEQETEPLDDTAARAVCERVLADGRTRTPADFRRRVRAAVIAVDPIGAALRSEAASERRQVSRRVLPDGQAALELAGPATAIAAIWAVLTRRAGLTHPDDPRTLDQKRFDAMLDICRSPSTERELTDLVRVGGEADGHDGHDGHDGESREGSISRSPDCDGFDVMSSSGFATRKPDRDGSAPPGPGGSTSGSRRPRKERRRTSRTGTTAGVFVFADVATWAGLADNPVDLDGYGPIPPGMARECFTDSQWRAVVTDALTGLVASVSDTSYTPSPRTRRHLFAQDRGCLFPGCSAPVWYCDADHSTPHDEGGCTDPDNCGLLCRRHHRLKTFTGWTWTRYDDGTVAWTSPDGRVWTRPPQRYHQPPVTRTISRDDACMDRSTDPRTGPAPTRAGPGQNGPDQTTTGSDIHT